MHASIGSGGSHGADSVIPYCTAVLATAAQYTVRGLAGYTRVKGRVWPTRSAYTLRAQGSTGRCCHNRALSRCTMMVGLEAVQSSPYCTHRYGSVYL